MKVKEIMTKEVIFVDKDEDLRHVIKLMKKNDITKIPVVDDKKIVGIITDNMIAYKLGSIRKKGVPAARLHASSVTEKDIPTVTPDTDVKKVLKSVGKPGPTMLPVTENEKLVGVITKADLLPLVESNEPVTGIMEKNVHTISPDDRVIHARRIMIDENIARIPVVDKGQLIGMISDIEIVYALAKIKRSFSLGKQKHQLDELLVKDVMKTPAIWIPSNLKTKEVASVMLKQNVGALPIIENNMLIGIVTRTNILKTITL